MVNSYLLIKFLNNKDEVSWYERRSFLEDHIFKEKIKNSAWRLHKAAASIHGGTFHLAYSLSFME